MDLLEAFHFIRPLWLLALLPMAWLWWRLYRGSAQSNQWQHAVDPELLDHLLDGEQGSRDNRYLYLVLALAWLVAVVALAGPSWERRDVPTYRNVTERVLVIDLSRSMNVQDVKPYRLGRVRQKVEDIVNKGGDVENAVVVYAATPFVVSPLTNDAATILSMLPALKIDIMPAQGSRTGLALKEAYDLLQSVKSKHGSILLFTDSAVDADAMSMAKEISAQGLSLSVIGAGSPEGAPIPHPKGGFIKDRDSNIVVAKVDENALRDLARAGGGEYRRISSDESDIDYLLDRVRRADGFTDKDDSQQLTDQWLDRGPWLMLLLLPVAAMAFRRGWL